MFSRKFIHFTVSVPVTVMTLAVFFIDVLPAHGATWSQNSILSNSQLEDYYAMTEPEIQQFLASRGSLGSYVTTDIDGVVKSASSIISRVAGNYGLNPQFLLTLLQREQGLVEGLTPSEDRLSWATGYAVCDRCDKDHPDLQEYRGFANQLEQTAKRFREVFLSQIEQVGKTFTGWGPGITKRTDGVQVTPENRATAALYTYTPHIAGNRLLWGIWQKWFSLTYPDGTLLRAANAKDSIVWLIQRGFKRPIVSTAALFSRFDPNHIITVSKEELTKYADGLPIKFPDYTLLRSPRGTIYLTDGDNMRGFPSMQVFRSLGFSEDEVTDASWEDLSSYTEISPLTMASSYPRGGLLQNQETGGVYFVKNGIKYPIWSKELMQIKYPGRKLTTVSAALLDEFVDGTPVLFSDGELIGIRGDQGIYVVSDGTRRPIPSAEIFLGLGFDWSEVVWTTEKAVSAHPLGDPITLPDSSNASIAVK